MLLRLYNLAMLGLQLEMSIRAQLRQLVERLLNIADFFVFKKRLTLSEMFLFCWTASRAVWYGIFGVTGGFLEGIFPDAAWIAIFWTLTVFKVVSLFFFDSRLRSWAVIASAVLWGSLTILAAFSQTSQPVAPTYGIFALLSVFIAVRLIHDEGRNVP